MVIRLRWIWCLVIMLGVFFVFVLVLGNVMFGSFLGVGLGRVFVLNGRTRFRGGPGRVYRSNPVRSYPVGGECIGSYN